MASPFRNDKKTRKRWRKAADRSARTAAKLEGANPVIAAYASQSAEFSLKVAGSRRKKKPKIPGTHN